MQAMGSSARVMAASPKTVRIVIRMVVMNSYFPWQSADAGPEWRRLFHVIGIGQKSFKREESKSS
jgi:hypothetical protein